MYTWVLFEFNDNAVLKMIKSHLKFEFHVTIMRITSIKSGHGTKSSCKDYKFNIYTFLVHKLDYRY